MEKKNPTLGTQHRLFTQLKEIAGVMINNDEHSNTIGYTDDSQGHIIGQ